MLYAIAGVKIGSGTKKTPIITLRLIEVRVGKVFIIFMVLQPEERLTTPLNILLIPIIRNV